MDQSWQQDAPRLTANEADYLVEMWLRQRLQAPDQLPLDTNKLSLRELAAALGTTEQDLALLLCQIRDKRARKKALPARRAMPVRKTMILIAGIYTAMFGLCYLMWHLGFTSGRQSGYYPPAFASGPPTVSSPVSYTRNPPGHPNLHNAIGFRFRDSMFYANGSSAAKDVDWKQAQAALVDRILSLSSAGQQVLAENLTQQEIDQSLHGADGVLLETSNPYNGMELGEPRLPDTVRGDRLVGWEIFTLVFDGREISTIVPIPHVANPLLDAAIKTRVENSVKKLLEVVKSGKAATNPQIIR